MENQISHWTKNWLLKNQIEFQFLEVTKSTNDLAKKQIFKSVSSPMIFLTNKQTRGRGQGEKTWEDSDLMISFLWQNNLKPVQNSSSKDFAFDLCKALNNSWDELSLEVKAPNDIYLEKQKIAGLLLEIFKEGSKLALVVGLGLNVFCAPDNLIATCIGEKTTNIQVKIWENFLDDLFTLWNKRACLVT